MTTESSLYRSLTAKYCVGCGLDVASQGDPVVPWAWQLDLPPDEFAAYNGGGAGIPPHGPIQLRGHADKLPVSDESLDFLYCSHMLEDVAPPWTAMLKEWVRVLKKGGKLVVLVPDKERWLAAVAKGQPPNTWHKHEARVGELSEYAKEIGVRVIEDRLTDLFPGDYSIIFAAEKL